MESGMTAQLLFILALAVVLVLRYKRLHRFEETLNEGIRCLR